jgi:hypothetical protein
MKLESNCLAKRRLNPARSNAKSVAFHQTHDSLRELKKAAQKEVARGENSNHPNCGEYRGGAANVKQ